MRRTLLEDVLKEEASSASNKIASLVRNLAETYMESKNEISLAYVKEKLDRTEDIEKDSITPLDILISDLVSTLVGNL